MKSKIIISIIVSLVVGFGVGFVVFHKATPKGFAGAAVFTGGNRSFGQFASSTATRRGTTTGGGLLMGTVSDKTSSSITLNTGDGSSHLILITPQTTISKMATGSLSDVSVGSSLSVEGQTNSDGSISATTIQLRPAGQANAPMIPAGMGTLQPN